MQFIIIALYMFILTFAAFCCIIGIALNIEKSKFSKWWLFSSIAASFIVIVMTFYCSDYLFSVNHAMLIFVSVCDVILFYSIIILTNDKLPKCVCKYLQLHLNPEFTIKIAKGEFGVCPRCRKGIIKDFWGNWVYKED